MSFLSFQFADRMIAFSHLHSLPFEKSYDCMPLVKWVGDNMHHPFIQVAVYLLGIYFGSIYMAKRNPLALDTQLALWNLGLSLFSMVGALRTMPYLIATVSAKGFVHSICANPVDDWFSGPTGFWVAAMLFSKTPELIDTVFIVVMKKVPV